MQSRSPCLNIRYLVDHSADTVLDAKGLVVSPGFIDMHSHAEIPDDEALTPGLFSALIGDENRMLKALLVGKNAVVVGLSNSAFQDIVYRAGLHPKRKGSSLTEDERRALHEAMRLVIDERLRPGGKDKFLDLYGNRGGYTPAMGPHMKKQSCPGCGGPIEGLQVSGGVTYICPACQVR